MPVSVSDRRFGPLLREWRLARRLTQHALAEHAEISTRHLSFLETGRSQASREMTLVLGNALELSLRERNMLLAAAGFAPVVVALPVAPRESRSTWVTSRLSIIAVWVSSSSGKWKTSSNTGAWILSPVSRPAMRPPDRVGLRGPPDGEAR